jgi:hypothetical protein
MTRYYYGVNIHPHAKYKRRIRKSIVIVLLITIVIVSYLVYDSWRQGQKAQLPSDVSTETSATYTPSIKVHRTAYFQFQTDQTWSHVVNESTANKFVYRSLRSKLVEHDLTIYINQPDINPEASRVLPVELQSTGALTSGFTSDVCRKSLPPSAKQLSQLVVIKEVSFMCDYDAADYSVVVGIRGQKVPFTLSRPDGTTTTYAILYHNLKAVWDDAQLRQIVDSFQTR